MKTKWFWLPALCLLATLPLRAAYEGLSDPERQRLLEQHYSRAIEYFNTGNYSRAIYHWEEILRIDPEQTSPPDMIRQARAKLAQNLSPVEKALDAEAKAGRYAAALAKAQELVDKDPSQPLFRAKKAKLEKIAAIKPQESGATRSSQLIRKALYTFLTDDEKSRFSVNAARYARDLNPKHPGAQAVVSLLEQEYPDTAKKEQIVPGMSVVDHKLRIALTHIYEGRYDLAIFDCDEVLELDPPQEQTVLALKRKGSAYFALTQKEKAREIWREALKLAPNDPELKKFLSK